MQKENQNGVGTNKNKQRKKSMWGNTQEIVTPAGMESSERQSEMMRSLQPHQKYGQKRW